VSASTARGTDRVPDTGQGVDDDADRHGVSPVLDPCVELHRESPPLVNNLGAFTERSGSASPMHSSSPRTFEQSLAPCASRSAQCSPMHPRRSA